MFICEKCFSTHDGKYASGRFCSQKCSRSFSTSRNRKDISEKTKKTWGEKPLEEKLKSSLWLEKGLTRECIFCNETFQAKRPAQKSCSTSCARRNKESSLTEEQKTIKSKKLSQLAIERHQVNSKFGWQTRKQIEPSYPESIAIKFFETNNIKFEREFKIGKYFADFMLHERLMIIEIDGQQHKKPERKKSDTLKDEVIKSNGLKILRIKWPEENIIVTLTSELL